MIKLIIGVTGGACFALGILSGTTMLAGLGVILFTAFMVTRQLGG